MKKEHKEQEIQQLKMDQKTYNNLMLRKRLIDKQIQNIKTMSYHQILEKTRKNQPIQPPSPTMNFVKSQIQQQLRQAGVQQQLQQRTDKLIQDTKKIEKNKAIIRKQMRIAPIWSQIKRGKLGFDGVLILFGIFGSFLLPYIFYEKFKKNKQIIISSRKYSPEFIQNLTQDSPVDIDQVSQQSIHYDNPSRRKQTQQFKKRRQKIQSLKKQLDL